MNNLFMNNKKSRKTIAPLLAAAFLAGCFACGAAAEETDTVRFGVLSGPTGIGAAKLLTDSDNGETTNTYDYIIASDNSEIVSGLTTGELDIACMASNTALNLYNQGVEIQVIALGTQGVLHILESGGGEEIQSISDLEGRTIYTTGQGSNPEYILRYLLESNDLDPDSDVEIVFADATEISAGLISGEIETAMLPVPAATAAILQSDGTVRDALDVNDIWEEIGSGSSLIMTAVVARTEFIEEYPNAVEAFLDEYEASIGYVNSNVEEAAELVAELGITPSAAIAAAAIPQCNLIFISGEAMEPAISDYYDVLYEADPDSVGGALPDDGFYYYE
ncbi:MAG: ABC transporter substrate-binding protein [Lachnospiraceae bacterium]|nr:ABC transporter substrate-binding protein [Lachnospiraceae bacterium]